MKVLVTGREGQLARSLLERGQNRPDLEIVAVGRPELDLEQAETIYRTIRAAAPDAIINAAAYTAVDQAEDEPERAMRVNGAAAGEIAAAARRVGARVIQISTDYVFDGAAEGDYSEDDPVNPLGVYGRSKQRGEAEVRRENPQHLIVRTAWVYSPFGRNFVKTMMALARDRDQLTVVADQYGNPSSALDLADGLLAVLDRWKQEPELALGRTFHLAGTGSASWFEFAQLIQRECRSQGLPSAEVHPISAGGWPAKAPRPTNSRLDCARFALDFGFSMPNWQASAIGTVARLARSP
jgi:dTDP-4-dehydrorhamnose reductase